MDSSTSPEHKIQQVESAQKELEECRKTKARSQYNDLNYRSLVENANEAILVAQNGIFQYANPKAEDLFGYSQKELTSKPLAAFIHKKDSQMVMQRHESRFEGFILLDYDRVINEVNKVLLKISGYGREDFIGHPVDKFYDKTSIDFYSASPDHFSFEALFRANSGRRIPMLFSRSTLKDENDKISGFMII